MGLGGYMTDVGENLTDKDKHFQDKDPDREHPNRAGPDCSGYMGGNSECPQILYKNISKCRCNNNVMVLHVAISLGWFQ